MSTNASRTFLLTITQLIFILMSLMLVMQSVDCNPLPADKSVKTVASASNFPPFRG